MMEEFSVAKGGDSNPKGNNSYHCNYESAYMNKFRS